MHRRCLRPIDWLLVMSIAFAACGARGMSNDVSTSHRSNPQTPRAPLPPPLPTSGWHVVGSGRFGDVSWSLELNQGPAQTCVRMSNSSPEFTPLDLRLAENNACAPRGQRLKVVLGAIPSLKLSYLFGFYSARLSEHVRVVGTLYTGSSEPIWSTTGAFALVFQAAERIESLEIRDSNSNIRLAQCRLPQDGISSSPDDDCF